MLIPSREPPPRPLSAPGAPSPRPGLTVAAPSCPSRAEPAVLSPAEASSSSCPFLGRSLFPPTRPPAGISARCGAERSGDPARPGPGVVGSAPAHPTDPFPEPLSAAGWGSRLCKSFFSANPCPRQGGPSPPGGTPLTAAGERWGARAGQLLSQHGDSRALLALGGAGDLSPSPGAGQGLRPVSSGSAKNPAREAAKLCFN